MAWSALHFTTTPEMFLGPFDTSMRHLNLLTRETMPIDSTPVGVMMADAQLFGPSFGLDYHKLPPPWWDPQYKLDVLNNQISNIQASQFNHTLEKLMSVLMQKRHWMNESLQHLKRQNFKDIGLMASQRLSEVYSDISHGQQRGEFLSRGIPYEYANLDAGMGMPTSSQWHNLTDYTPQDQAALLQSMGFKEDSSDGASLVTRNDGCYSHDDEYSCNQDITDREVLGENGAYVYEKRCFWDPNHIEPGSANAHRGVLGRCIPRQWDEEKDSNFDNSLGKHPLNNSEWHCQQESQVGTAPTTCLGAYMVQMRDRLPDKLFPKEGIVQQQLERGNPTDSEGRTIPVPVLVPGNPTDVDPQLSDEKLSSVAQFRWWHKDAPYLLDGEKLVVDQEGKAAVPDKLTATHFGLEPAEEGGTRPRFEPWTFPKFATEQNKISGEQNEHLQELLAKTGAAIPVAYGQNHQDYADFIGNVSAKMA